MNTYLVYGNDYSLIKRKIDDITGATLDIVRYDLSVCKIDELLDDACTISLFNDKKVLIGENANFLTTSSTNVDHNIEYFEKYLNDNNHDNIVIISVISDKLDERKRIVKDLRSKATVIKTEVVEEKDLPNFVIKEFKDMGYNIDYRTANYFIEYVGKNIDILLS